MCFVCFDKKFRHINLLVFSSFYKTCYIFLLHFDLSKCQISGYALKCILTLKGLKCNKNSGPLLQTAPKEVPDIEWKFTPPLPVKFFITEFFIACFMLLKLCHNKNFTKILSDNFSN